MAAPKKYYDHRTGQMKPTGQGKLAPFASNPPAPNASEKRSRFARMVSSIFGKKSGRR